MEDKAIFGVIAGVAFVLVRVVERLGEAIMKRRNNGGSVLSADDRRFLQSVASGQRCRFAAEDHDAILSTERSHAKYEQDGIPVWYKLLRDMQADHGKMTEIQCRILEVLQYIQDRCKELPRGGGS